MSSTGRVLTRSTVRPNTSRLVGSIQCASSKIISTGCCASQSRDLRRQRFQRSLPALYRAQRERGIASIIRQRQHLGKECGILKRGRGLCASTASSLSSLRLRGVVVRQSGGTFHLADDRIKRAVGVLRRAEIAQARVRLGSEAFQKRSREPRFADTGLAGEQHHLTFAGLALDQRRSSSSSSSSRPTRSVRPVECSRLEAAFH